MLILKELKWFLHHLLLNYGFYCIMNILLHIYPEINCNINKAIERAKKIEEYQVNNRKLIGTVESNPSTEMYKIVEYLIESN